MERYSNLHQWMLILFFIAQLSIFNYYWPNFGNNSWEIHIHYWLSTAWYLFLIVQPYLISKGKNINHRTWGLVGFLLAGGFIFMGISLLDIPLKLAEAYNPERPGPPIAFYYGTLVVEFILAMAFTYAIIKSIIHRQDIKEHAWWLICSGFYMIAPALGRGMITFWRNVLPPEKFSPMYVFISAELIYIPLLLVFAYKFGKIRHTATYIGLALVLVRFLRLPIGSSEWIQNILQQLIKW